ncbi:MAG: STAS domain-containing protein [Tepidisphaerales bacterium]
MASLNQIEQDGLTVLKIEGSLTSDELPSIEGTFTRLARQHGAHVIVDLAQVDMLTTPAITMFIATSRACQRNGGHMVFTQSTPRIRNLLHRLRLDDVLDTAPEFLDAICQVKSS